jgi:hypothetical protein
MQPSNNDPFAAATTAQVAGSAPVDPNADPFASPSETGGTSGPRGPKWVDILDRLVVLKPIKLLVDQPMDPSIDSTPGKVQNIWVVDLTVLGTTPVKVFSPAREANGKNYPASEEVFETPFTWPNWYAYGKGVEVKLSGVEKAGKPMLLGVVRRCPTGQGYRGGETADTIARKWDEWRTAITAGRDMPKPQFSWGIEDASLEQRQEALAWYRGQ